MITTAAQLETALSGPIPPGRLARAYGRDIVGNDLWEDAMRMAAASEPTGPAARTAFHAGWALEHAYFSAPGDFTPFIGRFLEDFVAVRNPSVHRHYTKIMSDLLRRGAVRPNDVQAEAIVERCFDFLIDPDVRVGVKVWAMEALERLAPRVEWVGEHLCAVVGQLMADGTPAVVSRGRKLMRRLRGTLT
jgi:hypothetical protein